MAYAENTPQLLQLIEQHAVRNPDHIAVHGDELLTYHDLVGAVRRASDRIRDGLISASRRPHIFCDFGPRGPQQIVRMLATVAAGHIYAPIESELPDQILEDIKVFLEPEVALGDDELAPLLATSRSVRVSAGRRPALLLFTSGTTGTRKAIVQTVDQLTWFCTNQSLAPLDADDVVAHAASTSFDSYIFEVLRTLSFGATVRVTPLFREMVQSGLGKSLRDHRISVLLAPATVVNTCSRFEPDAFNSLGRLYSGGSELYSDSYRRIEKAGFSGYLANLYGPAEGTVACTQMIVTTDSLTRDVVPIGLPLNGAYVRLDRDGLRRESLQHEPGRVILSGPSVSEGYLQRTIADTFDVVAFGSPGPNMRSYLTSDLVEQDDDGVLHFLGRVEGLLKINGVRTSMEEIQVAVIRSGADECVVVPSDVTGQRATAYVKTKPGGVLADVEDELRRFLPAAILPSLVAVDIIPKNVNGKPDVAALTRDTHPDTCAQPHKTSHEEPLLGLLGRLFPSLTVAEDRDIFDLGANSLEIVLLIEFVHAEYGVLLDPEDVLTNTRISDLVALIHDRVRAQDAG